MFIRPTVRPRPGFASTIPRNSSDFVASRRLNRLTPKRDANSVSVGKRSPGRNISSEMYARNRSATTSRNFARSIVSNMKFFLLAALSRDL